MKHLYRNELEKDCFSHDVAYFDSKDLAKRTISDTILKKKYIYKITRNRGFDGYQALAGSGVSVNKQLA